MTTEPRLGPRFGPEAGLILAAAAFAALLELSWPGVIAVVLCAWLAVAVFEIVRARVRPAPFAAPPSARVEPRAEPELAREPKPEPAPEPSLAAEPTASAEEQAASLVAAPEQVEADPPPEQERYS